MDSFPKKKPKDLILLGFDFGTKRIGAAVGQNITHRANALNAIVARDGIPDWEALDSLVAQWKPDAFVVGLPYNMDDTKSELLIRARKFGNRLNGRYHKPCYGIDERLSTFEARGQIMRGESTAQRDCLAAQLILETWLQCLVEKFP